MMTSTLAPMSMTFVTSSDAPFVTSDNSNMTSQWTNNEARIHLAFYTLIGGIGMLDNGLVIIIIMSNKAMKQKVCNMLIIHQSVVDFVGSLLLVINSPLAINGKPPAGLLGELYCRFWANSFLLFTGLLLSIVNLVFVTFERFAEIVHPIRYRIYFTRRRVVVVIVLMWILCPAVNFALVGYASKLSDDEQYCAIHQNYPSETVRLIDAVLVYLLSIAIPLVVMAYCYVKMLRAMKRVVPASTSMSVSERSRCERQQRVRRNLLKTLLTVSFAYILCVSWNQTYFLLLGLGVPLPYDSPFYHFTVYALFTNSIINPFIYTAKYRQFQEAAKSLFIKLMPCFCKNNNQNNQRISTITSRQDNA